MSMKKSLFAALAFAVMSAGAAYAGPVPEGTKMDEHIYFNFSLGSEPSTLDISRRSDAYSSYIQQDIYEGLVRLMMVDGKPAIAPREAASWDVSEDGLTWTFHLRDDIKWEDGEPVTAEQYVYGLRRTADPKTASPNAFFLEPLANYEEISKGEKGVEELGVSAPDSKTLVMKLTLPDPLFLYKINTTVYYPQREDKIKEWGDKAGTEAKYTISNSGFKVADWVHNNKIELVKNENFYDAKNVYAEKVTYRIIADAAATLNSFKAGEIDSYGVTKKEELEELRKMPGMVYVTAPSNQVNFGFFNCNDKVFKNAKIRKAFALAIDLDLMNEMVYGTMRTPANGWVLPQESVNGKNYREQAGDMYALMKKELEDKGMTPRDLLIEGMKEEGLGDDPSKLDVSYSLGNTDAWMRNCGEFIQSMYADVLGVNLKLNYMEWGVFNDKLNRGDYQIGLMAWGSYYPDPYELLSLFDSKQDMIKTRWKNEKFDTLITAAKNNMDEAKRAQELMDAEKVLMVEEGVVFPTAFSVSHAIMPDFVKNSMADWHNEGDLYIYTDGRK